jgi:predicted MFS family arabinose efflux permease
MGCLGTIVSLMSVGLATNFWMALVGRALGGALNGNMGVIQTMVGEMITNPKHEREYACNDMNIHHTDNPQRKRTPLCPSYGR